MDFPFIKNLWEFWFLRQNPWSLPLSWSQFSQKHYHLDQPKKKIKMLFQMWSKSAESTSLKGFNWANPTTSKFSQVETKNHHEWQDLKEDKEVYAPFPSNPPDTSRDWCLKNLRKFRRLPWLVTSAKKRQLNRNEPENEPHPLLHMFGALQ